MGNSVGLMLTTTLLATLIALPFAWLTSRCDLPRGGLFLVLGLAAMVIPSYLTAVTFSEAFGPKGILQSALEPLGVDRLPNIKGFRRRDAHADLRNISLCRAARSRGPASC